MALILHYFTKFGYDVVVKSSRSLSHLPMSFFCMLPTQQLYMHMPAAVHSVFANSAAGGKVLSEVRLHYIQIGLSCVNWYSFLVVPLILWDFLWRFFVSSFRSSARRQKEKPVPRRCRTSWLFDDDDANERWRITRDARGHGDIDSSSTAVAASHTHADAPQ